MPHDVVGTARTWLFVPANRPDRFAKAVASGADLVILDLEDAVPTAAKREARRAAASWLRDGGRAILRINPPDTEWFDEDLALAALPGTLGVMLPKARLGQALLRVTSVADVIALIETAAGLNEASAIAGARNVVRLAFGTIDLALDLDVDDDGVIAAAGTQIVIASRAAELPAPVDGITRGFDDPAEVERLARLARSRGFGGKLCIHPAQIAPTLAGFRPTPAQIVQARRIVEADRSALGAASAVDGAMIDRPVVTRARQVLILAGDRVTDRC